MAGTWNPARLKPEHGSKQARHPVTPALGAPFVGAALGLTGNHWEMEPHSHSSYHVCRTSAKLLTTLDFRHIQVWPCRISWRSFVGNKRGMRPSGVWIRHQFPRGSIRIASLILGEQMYQRLRRLREIWAPEPACLFCWFAVVS